MSALNGSGYGDSHAWQWVRQVGHTTAYLCEACGATFTHYYHTTPIIFEAIKKAGVVDQCMAMPKKNVIEGVTFFNDPDYKDLRGIQDEIDEHNARD